MKKKSIRYILLAAFAMVLTGCGNGAKENTQEKSEATQDTLVTDEKSVETSVTENNTTEESITETDSNTGKTLVVYYSATGNTKKVAEMIAQQTSGDLFELVPMQAYTNEDLDWTDSESRVSVEHDNPNEREVELTAQTVDNWDEYDTVYIGYPIWWGIAAWPVDTFVKANNFSDKTVIPFATAASSGFGQSGELLQEMAGTGTWLEGECFRGSATEDDIKVWVER